MTSTYTQQVIKVFELHEDPIKAAPMAKYMKGKYAYFGINSPTRKEISKPLLVKSNLPNIAEVPKVVRELWDQPQREFVYFAQEFLQKYAKASPAHWIDLYEELIITKSWWDSVDGLAASHVGAHFKKYPEQIKDYTEKWMASGNMWLQRTCLIFQLKYRDQTDFELMKSFIIPLSDSKEFFIRKAIGWALRQYTRTNPDAVIDFVAEQPMSNLSQREALRLLK